MKLTLLVRLLLFICAVQVGCASMPMMDMSAGQTPVIPSQIDGVQIDQITDAKRMLVRQVHLQAPQDEVFNYLVNFEAMTEWLPGLNHVSVNHENSGNGPNQVGVGTNRTCSVTGATVEEEVVHFDAPQKFAYRITHGEGHTFPFEKGAGFVSLKPTADGGTDVSYYVFYETKSFHPMAPVAPMMFGKQLGQGLENLANKFGGYRIE